MAKKKEEPQEEMVDLFVGGEEDDLSDMEYIQDETKTTKVDTHPPETKDEADAIAEAEPAEEVTDEEPTSEEPAPSEEAEPEKAEEEPVPDDDEGIKVPKDRFDEVNQRMKDAEAENRNLKTQLETVVEEKNEEPEPEPYDYKAKEKEAMDALLEGDSEKYSAINEEIRAAEKAEYIREAQKLASKGDQELKEGLTFDEAGAQIEADFPAFVEGGEGYNPEAREELMDLYVGYAKSGIYTRVQALQRAAAKAAKMHGLTPSSEPPEEVPDNVVDIKPTDVKSKVAADKAQPPAMESAAENSTEEPIKDFNSMSDEEFEALPESTKRRARGDFL